MFSYSDDMRLGDTIDAFLLIQGMHIHFLSLILEDFGLEEWTVPHLRGLMICGSFLVHLEIMSMW